MCPQDLGTASLTLKAWDLESYDLSLVTPLFADRETEAQGE